MDYHDFCYRKWHKVGRWYDCIMSLLCVDFIGKTVCELGARDSIFSSYITKYVNNVYASDIFEGWGDLGDLQYWDQLWKSCAYDSNKLIAEKQNMTNLTYPDSSMDIVLSFSAIEHIPRDGDIVAISEMSRVCKPGGIIVISTEIGEYDSPIVGGYMYSEETLQSRLIGMSGCSLIGDCDFSIDGSESKQILGEHEFSSVIFFLRKPE